MAWYTERSPDRAPGTVLVSGEVRRDGVLAAIQNPLRLVPLLGNGQMAMSLPMELESFPHFTGEAEVVSLRFQSWLVTVQPRCY